MPPKNRHPKKPTPKDKMDTTFFRAITPTIATMLTGYITVSDAFLAPLTVVMESVPAGIAWLDSGAGMVSLLI